MKRWGIIAAILAVIVVGFFFRVPSPEIVLPAETIFSLGSFTVSNSVIGAWIVLLFLLVLSLIVRSRVLKMERTQNLVPSGFVNFVEWVCEFMINLCESVAGRENGRRFLPLVGSIFIFVICANYFGLLPLVGTVGKIEEPHAKGYEVKQVAGPVYYVPFGFKEGEVEHSTPGEGGVKPERPGPGEGNAPAGEGSHGYVPRTADGVAIPVLKAEASYYIIVPYLRAPTSDLNMTLALGLITMITVQVWGFRTLGFRGYGGKFIVPPWKDPIGTFIGLIEIISELSRVISFAFRLFGNIFAGEVLLLVITFLVPWGVVLPFYGLELFVGFVQALVFAMLALVFASIAVTSHHGEDAHPHHAAEHGEPAAKAAHGAAH